MTEKWAKGCDCKSASTSGQLRHVETKTSWGVRIDFIFYPQPSCDKCGTPWKFVRGESTIEDCGDE